MNYLNQQLRRLTSKDERHFCPTTPMAGMRELHLYYPLSTLQKEIEKRTYYLGKYRRPADAPVNDPNVVQAQSRADHLLDLIGMSRDEADVLYPFAKAAMADVFDHINRATPGYPKIFDWEDSKGEVKILRQTQTYYELFPDEKPVISASSIGDMSKIAQDENTVIISGPVVIESQGTDFSSGDVSLAKAYLPAINFEIEINAVRIIKGSESDLERSIVATGIIPAKSILYVGFNSNDKTFIYSILPTVVHFDLAEETEVATAERITSIEDFVPLLNNHAAWVSDPAKLKAGSRFQFDALNEVYETREDTDENKIRANCTEDSPYNLPDYVFKLATNDTYFEEGIHYYLGMPAFLNESLINPLDNAILEALVNRIIWKWLALAYPDEAANYDKFYNDAVNSLRERCNVFNKNWVNRTSRMY